MKWCSFVHLVFVTINLCAVHKATSEVFTLGYLTGSQRKVGDLEYIRPGLTISGAISLAVSEVNSGILKDLGHSIEFIVAETYGEEVSSIRQTAALWTKQVAGYIGPQETCVHFCTHRDTSNKKDFPTFARTRPPDTQISKSVLSLLMAYNWTRVTFLYLDSEDNEFGAVAETIVSTLEAAGVRVHMILTWNTIYHHGYSKSPFDDLVELSFTDTRIYLILGHYYEHLGLLLSLEKRGLLEQGEYFVVGIDIEQYDTSDPGKYLKGLLQDEKDQRAEKAFRSYMAIVPSAPVAFNDFAIKVNKFMELPPFNFPNPLNHIGGVKQIRAEAAYLYDAVHLYTKALIRVMRNGANPRNGSHIIDAIKGSNYLSAMGYLVHMDENGDAAGNYTVLALGRERSRIPKDSNRTIVGLYPLGTFSKLAGDRVPDLQLSRTMNWLSGKPPIAEPQCGFRGEKCISYTGEISAGIAGVALLLLGIVSLVLYRNWKYEQELDSLLWKVDYKEIQMHESDKENNGQKLTRATHPLIRTSQVSLSSNPDADFRYSTIFTPIGLYKGQLYAIKKVQKKYVDITREMKKELKLIRDLRHDNICAFIGACTDPPNICIITEYCNRGSLKDVLENEDVKLDNMFTASMVADIIRGMIYLHESPLRFHGSLCTSNCLIDSRWVVKISDFGLQGFKQGADDFPDLKNMSSKHEKLFYKAPELLRAGSTVSIAGTCKGDVYSFGIVLYEIHTRQGPYGEEGKQVLDCLRKILNPIDPSRPFRPSLQPLESSFDCVRECLVECWAERPEDRPDFKMIRAKLRPLRKGMRPNIFDNMMAMMEKYANNLEALVDERTDQLQGFKQGADDFPDLKNMSSKHEKLFYKAPELLRAGSTVSIAGTCKGDVYSFGIVLYEIHTRQGPYGEEGKQVLDCLRKILNPIDPSRPFRPSLQPLESSFDCVRECLVECWAERPEDRPDFKMIRAKLRPLRKGMRPNIFDNMMAMMEKYANNLEALVDERTDQLQEEKKKTEALLLEMLPRPVAEQLKKGHKVEAESYDMVTIYFSDIVGFTAMSAESTPLQVVDFLNDLYTCFDSIIGHYDVYKVETIGDAYMVVSGLPIRNGIIHAAEIASMSLHLLDAVSEFKIRHRPNESLLLRIGIHSGPVCAGVVGLKMPRYCLFGDTVNTASRMESTGMPLKIHISGQCKQLLDRHGGYNFQERGVINIKGKGEQRTYWLTGENPEARLKRNKERTERRGSKGQNKLKQQSSFKLFDSIVTTAGLPRSSLKNRGMQQRPSLPRSSSLESPKKLRFASNNLLEHYSYQRYSDDALLEVTISDTSPRKSTNGSSDDFASSCPCIENLCSLDERPDGKDLATPPCFSPTAITPLLSNNIHNMAN
uniref:Guanylate cyclase n=2 Tax=Lutzomyia longipalpis TaxID=7200 RepID=A0A1B0EWC7_LUTLO